MELEMHPISFDEVRKIGLETLVFFDDLCKANDLSFSLGYGSLIGAVRHNGYIPWDDDIDVWMPRKDYNRFIELSNSLQGTRYQLIAPETNNEFLSPFAKLTRSDTLIKPSRFITGYEYGCSIDVFALDDLPFSGEIEDVERSYESFRDSYISQLNKYHAYTDGKKEPILKHAVKKVLYRIHTILHGSMAERILVYSRAMANEVASAEYVATIAGKTVYRKEWFKTTIDACFEGIVFPIPKMYDEILTQRYGEYMKFPPLSEQKVPHNFTAYYID